jgi:hypothetical protein
MQSPAEIAYFSALKRVLNAWDPLGVAELVDDEYDGYLVPIGILLQQGAGVDDLAAYLDAIVTGRMGMPGNHDDALSTAEKLRAVPRPIEGAPADVLAHLVGQMAWSVNAGLGSFVTLEFGQPHLEILHEPLVSTSTSEKVHHAMGRRSVKLRGDWHLWIEHAAWRITTMSGVIDHDFGEWQDWQEQMADLSGQVLTGIEARGAAGLPLSFDLGSTIELWPGDGIDGDLWSLHEWGGSIISCRPDGILVK